MAGGFGVSRVAGGGAGSALGPLPQGPRPELGNMMSTVSDLWGTLQLGSETWELQHLDP